MRPADRDRFGEAYRSALAGGTHFRLSTAFVAPTAKSDGGSKPRCHRTKRPTALSGRSALLIGRAARIAAPCLVWS
jgi:hypothetical protein